MRRSRGLLDRDSLVAVDLTHADFIDSVAIQAVVTGHTLAAETQTGALVGVVVAPNTEPTRVDADRPPRSNTDVRNPTRAIAASNRGS
jgi:hypothetical protein